MTLYDKNIIQQKTLIGRLHQYFLIYFETFSVPTADTLFLLILSILTLEAAHSIWFLYQHFLSGITEKSLNVFYYACSYAKVDYSRFMNTTVRITLKLIPDSLQTQPVFLCVDDTMVSKLELASLFFTLSLLVVQLNSASLHFAHGSRRIR